MPDRAFNDQRYFLETSKIAELGWVEQVQWEQGIKATIEWFLQHGDTWFSKDISGALAAHPINPSAQVVQPRGSARKFLVFGKSGWIGGLLGRLLDQQGEEFVFADCRLQVRVSVRRSTRLL